ncbi:Glycosyl transferase family 2 [Caballeronia terrestris]|uniref:Glycosyl transferase family 2 n=1 Tax=Caballeronia terrestris TaxID=1226301 RepID=A0A158K712_9BURK|nr:glycosyltransferase family 2 protein [Caballeronia terrestris]SAL76908.1 Glycosyl transferase family 2 [Caballeronia terrestris]
MLAIVIPAHNEAACIGACLAAARAAATHHALLGEASRVIVVSDACTDDTSALSRAAGADTLEVATRNVGFARAEGARFALALGARWLAFTDADSLVAPDWLAKQLECASDAVCGVVSVEDWGCHHPQVSEQLREHFALSYSREDGHRHVHGANFGVSSEAYLRAGGFAAMHSGEDSALVAALIASGASVAWSVGPRVVTSSRTDFRAPGGFGAILLDVTRSYEAGEPVGGLSRQDLPLLR